MNLLILMAIVWLSGRSSMAKYSSFDGHGVDVAVNRADDLDKQALTYIAEHPGCRMLDLGSGAGGQSKRMVDAGAQVVALDQFDFTAQFAVMESKQVQFILGDMAEVATLLEGQMFQAVVCQRTIHYVPYAAALQLLRNLRTLVTDKLFISVTGVGSLVGDVYPAAATPLPERFAPLSELGQEMFSITEPVCLYSEAEFRQLLCEAGWQVDECWVSAFGNIKAVCSTTT